MIECCKNILAHKWKYCYEARVKWLLGVPGGMKFIEGLPTACPPNHAVDVSYPQIWRVVTASTCCADEFKSHAARGQKAPPTVDECEFAACSMSTDFNKIRKLATRLPKKRYPKPYIAELSIPSGAGVSICDQKSAHVNFWMYASFDPVSAVVSVVEA